MLFINYLSIVFRSTFVYLQPLFVRNVLIVEGLILTLLIRCLDLLYLIFAWDSF